MLFRLTLLFSFFPLSCWGADYKSWRPSHSWSRDHEERYQNYLYSRRTQDRKLQTYLPSHFSSSYASRLRGRPYLSSNRWLLERERNYRLYKREKERLRLEAKFKKLSFDIPSQSYHTGELRGLCSQNNFSISLRERQQILPFRSNIPFDSSHHLYPTQRDYRQPRQTNLDNEERRQEAAIAEILRESQVRRNNPSFVPVSLDNEAFPQRSVQYTWDVTSFWPSESWSFEQEEKFKRHLAQQEIRPSKEKRTDIFLEKLKSFGIEKSYLKGSILHGGLNLSGELRELSDISKNEILELLTSLDWLDELRLDENNLTQLPEKIGHLKSLRILDLYKNKITKLPSELWDLTSLEDLDLSDNKLIYLYEENQIKGLGKLLSLNALHLNNVGLICIPSDIGDLKHLTQLYLHHNDLTSLPLELWTLNNLKILELRDNDITEISNQIGQLSNLEILDLSYNQLTYLPHTVGNLVNIVTLNLEKNEQFALRGGVGAPLSEQWGRTELSNHFHNKLVLSPFSYKKIISNIMKKYIYSLIDQKPYRIHRENVKNIQMPTIPVSHVFDGLELLSSFHNILVSLNFMDESKADYLSFSVLALDLEQKILDKYGKEEVNSHPNHSRIMMFLIPQFTGYFKTLYHIPLSSGESYGWQMEESNKPHLKRALTYIMETLNNISDKVQKAVLFTQFTYGMLHCPTGQKEGIDTVLLSLLEGNLRGVDFGSKIDTLLAIKKNMLFQKAILSKGATSDQNVHLITTYGERLKDELGLSSMVGDYHELLGTMGYDPFHGSEASVLKCYYDLMTPQCLISMLMEKIQSQEDLLIKQNIGLLQRRRDQSHFHVLLGQFENNLKVKKDRLNSGLLTEEEIFVLNQQVYILEQKVSQLRASAFPVDRPDRLSEQIKELMTEYERNKLFRPLTAGDFLVYLRQHQLVDLGREDWWIAYFSHNPLENELSVVSPQGVEEILLQRGIIIDERRSVL